MFRKLDIVPLGAIVLIALQIAGCQSGGLTAPQVAALNCVVASDGATVVAIVKPGLALPASGLATIGCQAGTQVGQIIGGAQ